MVLILSSSQTIGTIFVSAPAQRHWGTAEGKPSGACLGVVPSCVFVLAVLKSYVKSKDASEDARGSSIRKGKALVDGSIASPAQHSALGVRQAAKDIGDPQTRGTREGPSMQGKFKDPEVLESWEPSSQLARG